MGTTTIRRDRWGIPHISADSDADLFTGLGFAMAQDRLFQLDYLRRKGSGRLAEVLGARALPYDQVVRTVGVRRLAEAELGQLSGETLELLSAFSRGVNLHLQQLDESATPLPIEFALLDYRPELWEPVDCLTIECEFQWYLTGRLPVIVNPEMAKRALGDGPLYEEFILGEADDECIIPPGHYPTASNGAAEAVGQVMGGPDDGVGSNNWAASGRLTASHAPLVASDPHIAIEAVSCWYEVHLAGKTFDVSGACYAGMPAVLLGRNDHVAWTITNNICSQRDLYLESPHPDDPNTFLFAGEYERGRELVETIGVRGEEDRQLKIQFTRHGPIIDDLIVPAARSENPVSLRWVRAHGGGWVTSLLAMNRADSVDSFRDALRPWRSPTFSMIFADDAGRIRFRNTGRLPVRSKSERGMLPGWDPAAEWRGFIPFEAMPEWTDPERGWLGSANNRVAGDDFAYPLGGTWVRGHRAVRIREMFDERAATPLTREHFAAMHQDTASLRARERMGGLLAALRRDPPAQLTGVIELLELWDCRAEANSPATTLFNVFFAEWVQTVCRERFADDSVRCVLEQSAEAVSARLLDGDPLGWFDSSDRVAGIQQAMRRTVDHLTEQLGPDMNGWEWGRLHRLRLPHVLSERGELAQLLNGGDVGVKGDMGTICNTGQGPGFSAATGAGFRMIADLKERTLWSIDGQSQSGNPGSPHYRDQLESWNGGEYHSLPATESPSDTILTLGEQT
jgi:penicillin amidase